MPTVIFILIISFVPLAQADYSKYFKSFSKNILYQGVFPDLVMMSRLPSSKFDKIPTEADFIYQEIKKRLRVIPKSKVGIAILGPLLEEWSGLHESYLAKKNIMINQGHVQFRIRLQKYNPLEWFVTCYVDQVEKGFLNWEGILYQFLVSKGITSDIAIRYSREKKFKILKEFNKKELKSHKKFKAVVFSELAQLKNLAE